MILLKPNIPNLKVTVFVRNEFAAFDVKLVNSQTGIYTDWVETVTLDGTGKVTFKIPDALEEGNWYNLFVLKKDVLQNYSMIYCTANPDQQYNILKKEVKMPQAETPKYKMA
jgi:hypothetical protein